MVRHSLRSQLHFKQRRTQNSSSNKLPIFFPFLILIPSTLAMWKGKDSHGLNPISLKALPPEECSDRPWNRTLSGQKNWLYNSFKTVGLRRVSSSLDARKPNDYAKTIGRSSTALHHSRHRLRCGRQPLIAGAIRRLNRADFALYRGLWQRDDNR